MPALQNQIYEFLINIGQIKFSRPDWIFLILTSKRYGSYHLFQKQANRMFWHIFNYLLCIWTSSCQFVCRIINWKFDPLKWVYIIHHNINTLFWCFFVNFLFVFFEILNLNFYFKLKAIFKISYFLYFIKSRQLRFLFWVDAVLTMKCQYIRN